MMREYNYLRQILMLFVLGLLCSACEQPTDDSSAARKALEDLQQKYDELVEDKLGDPVEWAAEDIENIGDWDYKVVNLSFDSPQDLEDQLNELGNEKWQVIWLERSPDGFLAVLKKPSISYLSKIPLSQIGRYVIGGSEGTE